MNQESDNNKGNSDCDHFFISMEQKESASALGTHTSRCKKCNKNFAIQIGDNVEAYIKKHRNCTEQGCVHDSTLICKGEYKEQQYHVHCWDFDRDKRHYICISSIRDLKKTEEKKEKNIQKYGAHVKIIYSKPCDKIITEEY